MKDKYDPEEFYCPKLGHHLTFKYCRSENFGLPCSRIEKCCSAKIPVQEYLTSLYPKEVIQQIFQSRENKLTTILNIAEKANRIRDTENR